MNENIENLMHKYNLIGVAGDNPQLEARLIAFAKECADELQKKPIVEKSTVETEYEKYMKHWDSWRKFFLEGGTGSWPRDSFETILDELFETRASVAEKDKELAELKASNKQAWGICDAVAKALGEDLDRDIGSAESILLLQKKIAQGADPRFDRMWDTNSVLLEVQFDPKARDSVRYNEVNAVLNALIRMQKQLSEAGGQELEDGSIEHSKKSQKH